MISNLNREYLDTHYSYEHSLYKELVELVSNYYRIEVSDLGKKQLRDLTLESKLELINFYKKSEALADDSFELNIL